MSAGNDKALCTESGSTTQNILAAVPWSTWKRVEGGTLRPLTPKSGSQSQGVPKARKISEHLECAIFRNDYIPLYTHPERIEQQLEGVNQISEHLECAIFRYDYITLYTHPERIEQQLEGVNQLPLILLVLLGRVDHWPLLRLERVEQPLTLELLTFGYLELPLVLTLGYLELPLEVQTLEVLTLEFELLLPLLRLERVDLPPMLE